MKKLFILILLSVFSANAQKNKSYYNNQLREVGKYVNGKKSGIWKSFYTNDTIESIAIYKKGLKHGDYKEFFKNGQIQSIGYYLNDIPVKKWKMYYENGQLASDAKYKKGKYFGEYEKYYENGQLEAIGRYKNNLYFGNWKSYYETGQLRFEGKYKISKKNNYKIGEWIEYTMDGIVRSQGVYKKSKGRSQKSGEWKVFNEGIYTIKHYKNGVRVGVVKGYHREGWLFAEMNYFDNNTKINITRYFKNGVPSVKNVRILNNKEKKPSKYKLFYQNGQLMLLGQEQSNRFYGLVTLYHDNGQLYQIQEWDKKENKLINIAACLSTTGKVLDKGTLIAGNGTVKEYINDELINITTFKNGVSEEKYSLARLYWNDWKRLNYKAWIVYETNDSTKDSFAIKWIQRSISLEKNYYNLDTYAALLFKTKQYITALEKANEALTYVKRDRVSSVVETERLIVKIQAEINQK